MSSNILETIIAAKRVEVEKRKQAVEVKALEKSALFTRQTISLKESLISGDRSGIIAEFKRKSPSKGLFNGSASARQITQSYADLGASAVSVLTDGAFFGGSDQDLMDSRDISIPILRKDFIVDEFQILEARSIGADLILLIAACLSPEEVNQLGAFAKRLGLEVLLEIHSDGELQHISGNVDLVGVNNRDLKTFTVDLHRSIELAKKIPSSFPLISESGIRDANDINLLRSEGFSGFLIGETFMKEANPAIAFATFIKKLNYSQE